MLEDLLPVGARLAAADEALLKVDPARGANKASRVKAGVPVYAEIVQVTKVMLDHHITTQLLG